MTMTTQTEINFAKALYELKIPVEEIDDVRSILNDNPMLNEALCDVVVKKDQKHKVIDRIFKGEMKNFLKLLCDRNLFDLAEGIFKAYDSYRKSQNNILDAELRYVVPPSDEQTDKIKKFLLEKYSAADISLTMRKDSSLIGGFILSAQGMEYDWSIKGRLKGLSAELIGR